MEKVITSLNATNYQGSFSFDGGSGSFNTDGNKVLQSINGSKEGLGSFDAYRMGDAMHYNPHFSDPSKAADLVAVMTGAIEAIETELAAI